MTDHRTPTAVKHSSSKQPTKKSHAEEAFVELLRSTDLLSRGVARVLKRALLSWTQYNVLRILRGAREGLPCGEIAARMITRDPDITRLLDRLERRGLVSRSRQSTDRRTVITQITPAGVRVLAGLDRPIRKAHISQLGHLGRKRLQILTELLRACRHPAI
jgi:DNA-binding MarR family transcriptional regulator